LEPIYGPVGAPGNGPANSFSHVPFSGDELFNPQDPTFHHYDVETKICTSGQTNCNSTSLMSTQGLRHYPSKRLQATLTSLNGELFWVYVTHPATVNIASAYVLPFGKVSQRVVQQAPWTGAIQNVTDASHIVYPGTISRIIVNKGADFCVFTHGMEHNRVWCSNPDSGTKAVLQILIGWSNDVFGYKTFKTLDREFVKYWRSRNP
jgi:hypothetical protein